MVEKVKIQDSHYVLPIPFRRENVMFPNNRVQAVQRLKWLKKRLERNPEEHKDYLNFMKEMFQKGYAVKADNTPKEGKCWYLPHYPVYHPKKPGKVRIVFDCSTKFEGRCLNKEVIQGPDLTNLLVGVLCRFREENIAVMADLEKMFYQVRVPEEQQDFFRFLWWENNDLEDNIIDFRMSAHLQGCISSPSCANYALKKTAVDNEQKYGSTVSNVLKNSFYVDDLLHSSKDEEIALNVITKVRAMCAAGGFKLTKFASNSRKILQSIKADELAKDFKELNLSTEKLPVERALGVCWIIENDVLGFRIHTPYKTWNSINYQFSL